MGIIGWIILGLIAGAIAKRILPGTQGGGWIITLILGVVGALLGGFLGSAALQRAAGGLLRPSRPGCSPSVAPSSCC